MVPDCLELAEDWESCGDCWPDEDALSNTLTALGCDEASLFLNFARAGGMTHCPVLRGFRI